MTVRRRILWGAIGLASLYFARWGLMASLAGYGVPNVANDRPYYLLKIGRSTLSTPLGWSRTSPAPGTVIVASPRDRRASLRFHVLPRGTISVVEVDRLARSVLGTDRPVLRRDFPFGHTRWWSGVARFDGWNYRYWARGVSVTNRSLAFWSFYLPEVGTFDKSDLADLIWMTSTLDAPILLLEAHRRQKSPLVPGDSGL